MKSLFFKRIKSTFLYFLIFIVFFYFGFQYFIRSFKFMILDTNITNGIREKYYNYLYKMNIDYYYNIDGKIYYGTTSSIYRSGYDRESYNICYLLEKPNISMVNEIIIQESVIWFLCMLVPFSFIIAIFLAYIGKLPIKYQTNFDNYVNNENRKNN